MDITTIGILIAIIGILASILIVVIPSIYKTKRKMNALYEIIWKKSSKLKLNELLGIRGDPKHGFYKYHFQREEDKLIQKEIEDNKNILIIGNPLAGKSRAIYHSLITLKKPYDVIVPKLVDINLEDFRIPFRFTFWRKRVIVFDDLNKFADKQNFLHLLQEFIKINTIIIASCRSGPEYEKLCVKMEKELLVFDNTIKIPKVSGDQGIEIAQQVGINMPERFDGNIGSLFINLDAMKDRYKRCSHIEKGIMRSIKRLYYGGIYREREIFSITKIKILCNIKEEIDKKNYEWIELLKGLQTKGFIVKNQKGDIWIEEVYIDFVVEDEILQLDNFNDLMDIFIKDPETLFELGNKACDVAEISVQKKEYILIAIKSYKKVLKLRTPDDRFPMNYAATQNNLGTAYQILAEAKDKPENCQLAVKAFQEALKVYTPDRFPMDYAMTQNNLGTAYQILAEAKDKPENCQLAIKAFQKALEIRTKEHFPMDYAATQNNLGNSYRTLAEVKDKTQNCQLAIKAYQEALKLRTPEHFPMDYAMTQNNLGAAYKTLAVVKDKTQNCQLAIKACQEALKVYTLDRFPMDYAMTQNNLGAAYGTLAVVKNKDQNCQLAVKACQEALKVYTLDRFPMQYAMTQNNLGTAYQTLAEAKDKPENCQLAVKAFQEALKVYTPDRFPMDYAMTQNNLGTAYQILAEAKDKPENCQLAIKAFQKALEIRTKEHFPMDYAATQSNLGAAYGTLAEVKDKDQNCQLAVNAFQEALKVYTLDRFPMQYAMTQNNLKVVYRTLAEVEDNTEN